MDDVLLPQSFAVQAFAFGLAIGAALFGTVCWLWSGARSGDAAYRRGYLQGYDRGHDQGFVAGFREAGVLDRLVALDAQSLQADAEFRREAGMRRWRAAVEAWNAEGRRWA